MSELRTLLYNNDFSTLGHTICGKNHPGIGSNCVWQLLGTKKFEFNTLSFTPIDPIIDPNKDLVLNFTKGFGDLSFWPEAVFLINDMKNQFRPFVESLAKFMDSKAVVIILVQFKDNMPQER